MYTKRSPVLLASLTAWSALALATLSGASDSRAQQRTPPAKPTITATNPKEHWLTIVLDPADRHLGHDGSNTINGEAVESELRSVPTVNEVTVCAAWMIWFPISAQTRWSEIDAPATSVALVKRGKGGTIEATPLNLESGASSVRRWYWGPDTKGPDGASEWRMLVCGPPCDCCDPNCLGADNPEVGQHGLGVELHARSYQPSLNWPAAAALPWVEPDEKLATFTAPAPYIESDSPAVKSFVQHWVGNSPRANSPFLTALAFARAAAARAKPESTPNAPPPVIRGLRVSGASSFASSGNGNAHDAHCLSVAAMRAVGIPARVVVGF